LNASVDYKFFKNKAGIRLYVNDPFNSDTRYRSNVTATTRVESGSSFLHHYVSLTFNYKFDAK
ncbi:MAG: outer membrane beta-barrel protein, partial [bacterium]|nr:outer membrane beta-barrel protein [bacterium]